MNRHDRQRPPLASPLMGDLRKTMNWKSFQYAQVGKVDHDRSRC